MLKVIGQEEGGSAQLRNRPYFCAIAVLVGEGELRYLGIRTKDDRRLDGIIH